MTSEVKPAESITDSEKMLGNSVEKEIKEQPKEYTRLFFQRPLGFKQAAMWVFVHYMSIGIIQGYYSSVQFNLQSLGASFDNQSTLTLALYPYSFKFIFSPLLDRYFIKWFGRSKTYIILGGGLIGSVFMFLGPTVQRMITNIEVVPLTVLFMFLNLMVCVVQIAGEAWILTLFTKEGKAKATAFLNAGLTFGNLLGYNVFTPLNDLEWINDNLYPNHPRTSPILTHTLFCFIIAILFFSQNVLNLLFIAEEKITDSKAKDICKILSIVPRHFTNSYMRKLLLYMFATRFIYFMVDPSFDLKLVRNGYLNISRSVLANIDVVVYPTGFAASLLIVYYLKKGNLMKMFHLTMFFIVLNGTFKYLCIVNLIETRVYLITFLGRVFTSFTTGLDFTGVFMMSFFNTIVNKAVGNTGVTCLIAMLNQTGVLSQTIGFALMDHFNYHVIVLSCLSVQAAILLYTYKFTDYFDKRDSRYFDISEPEVKEGDLPTNIEYKAKA